jgi:uncharacterized membrane protein
MHESVVADATRLKRDRDGFLLRGADMTRIETFTDAAFAFALTLLVISNDPLASVSDLSQNLKLIPVFLMSGAILMMFWWGHHSWSRRYGLDDGPTVLLSILFVFTMLVYVYPLRMVFGTFMSLVSRTGLPLHHASFELENSNDLNTLFVIYGVGFVLMSLLLAALTWHAWRQRDALQLDAREQLLTRAYLNSWLILAAVGTASIVMALVFPANWLGAPGWAYALLSVIMPLYGKQSDRRLAELEKGGAL